MVKLSFYTGSNQEYFSKIRKEKKEKLKAIRLSSEIRDHSHIYNLWIEFITLDGRHVQSDKVEFNCVKLCDVRGYVNRDMVFKQFKEIFDQELTHKLI